MAIYKEYNHTIRITGENRNDEVINLEFQSYDKSVAKLVLDLYSENGLPINLTGASVHFLLVIDENQSIEILGTIEDLSAGKVSMEIPQQIKGYNGHVKCGVYIDFSDGSKIDVRNLVFDLEKSLIDNVDYTPIKGNLFQTFDLALTEIKNYMNDVKRDTVNYADTQKSVMLDKTNEVKAYGDNQKTQIGQVLPDVQNQVANLKSTLDTINETYPKIQASGINLWRYTKDYDGSKYDKWGEIYGGNISYKNWRPVTTIDGFGVQYITTAWDDLSQRVPVKPNTEYTLSAMIKLGSENSSVACYFDGEGGSFLQILVDGKEQSLQAEISGLSTTEYRRVSVTYNTGSGDYSSCRFEPQSNSSMYIYQPMFNEGYPLPWEPNPNDITDTIATTNSRLDNLSTGGENLIINGGFPTDTHGWTSTDNIAFYPFWHAFYFNGNKKIFVATSTDSNEGLIKSNRFKVKRNTTYALSFIGFAGSNVRSTDVSFLGRTNGESSDFTIVKNIFLNLRMSGSSAEFHKATFNTGDSDEGYLRFDHNGSTDGQIAYMFFGEVMLVEGTVVKKYQPSSADLILNSNPINSILTTLSQENPSTTLGGTWTQLGTETKFNNTLYYWRRTN